MSKNDASYKYFGFILFSFSFRQKKKNFFFCMKHKYITKINLEKSPRSCLQFARVWYNIIARSVIYVFVYLQKFKVCSVYYIIFYIKTVRVLYAYYFSNIYVNIDLKYCTCRGNTQLYWCTNIILTNNKEKQHKYSVNWLKMLHQFIIVSYLYFLIALFLAISLIVNLRQQFFDKFIYHYSIIIGRKIS